jgi:hypothetical protein
MFLPSTRLTIDAPFSVVGSIDAVPRMGFGSNFHI